MGKHAGKATRIQPVQLTTPAGVHRGAFTREGYLADVAAANTYRYPGKHALIGTGFGKLGRHHAARPVDGVIYDAAGNSTPLQRRPPVLDAVA